MVANTDISDTMQKKIQTLMQLHGISAYRLAKLTGLSESTLSRWLNGKSDIRLSNYKKIAKAIEKIIKNEKY